MSEESRKLVVLITQGLESKTSSVAFTIANGGITGVRSWPLVSTSVC